MVDHGGRGAQINRRVVGDEVGVGTIGNDRRAAGIDSHGVQLVRVRIVVKGRQRVHRLVHHVQAEVVGGRAATSPVNLHGGGGGVGADDAAIGQGGGGQGVRAFQVVRIAQEAQLVRLDRAGLDAGDGVGQGVAQQRASVAEGHHQAAVRQLVGLVGPAAVLQPAVQEGVAVGARAVRIHGPHSPQRRGEVVVGFQGPQAGAVESWHIRGVNPMAKDHGAIGQHSRVNGASPFGGAAMHLAALRIQHVEVLPSLAA